MTVLTKIDAARPVQSLVATGLAEGTNVRTPCGERRVELMRPGDMIVTRSNGLQILRHIFTITVTEALATADPSLAPITLTPRSIAPMMPQRAVTVAPGHKVLIPSRLIVTEAKEPCCLVSARAVACLLPGVDAVATPQEMVYYNLVFDAQEVFCANGAPVESYLPDGEAFAALERQTREELLEAFPDLRKNPQSYPPTHYRSLAEDEASPLNA